MHDTANILDLPSSQVDPGLVPVRTLSSGATMPAIGMGTFGSDHVPAPQVARAVLGAARIGYRHFDCAPVYGNEAEIGESLEAILKSGVERSELWITSKVWNDMHRRVAESCERSLRDLRLDYLDLYLVHWPFPNYHPPGCDASSRSPDAKPYIHAEYMETWGQMEALVKRGLVRHIGTSNMTVSKLQQLLGDCRIKPVANEMELHPHFQQPALFRFIQASGIVPIGYCPIGSPKRPERDRIEEDSVDTADPAIVEIANELGIHPATLCVKWAIQRGQVPIPFSTTPRNYLANLRAAVSSPLSEEHMNRIAACDRNCRLIKGQVFLWNGARSWEDLWDLEDRRG